MDGKGSPSIPRNVVAPDYANDDVRVTWEAPEDDGGLPATWYVVTLRDVDPVTGEFTDPETGYYAERDSDPADWTGPGPLGEPRDPFLRAATRCRCTSPTTAATARCSPAT